MAFNKHVSFNIYFCQRCLCLRQTTDAYVVCEIDLLISTAVGLCLYGSGLRQWVYVSTAVGLCLYGSGFVSLRQWVCVSTAVGLCLYGSGFVSL